MSDAKRRTDALAAGLAARILSGNWPEGTKLPADDEIGREFGVSRTVIREAYRILSGKGLLQARPRLGTHVAPRSAWSFIDTDMLAWLEDCNEIHTYLPDMMDMRLAVEPSLAALAAVRADDEANQSLQSALRVLQEAPNFQNEKAFIGIFYAMSGNPFAHASLPMAVMSINHRQTDVPLVAYSRLTAAIAQKDGVLARQCAFETLIEE